MTRMFVAVWPPPEVVAVLTTLERPVVGGVRWSEPAQWMVVVRPLGHVKEDVVAESLAMALDAALEGAPPAECVLGPHVNRPGGDWLAASVRGLDDLAAAVFESTEGIVPVTHPQLFRANLVLARGRVPRELAGQPVCASWVASSVALVADRSAPGRLRYVDVHVTELL